MPHVRSQRVRDARVHIVLYGGLGGFGSSSYTEVYKGGTLPLGSRVGLGCMYGVVMRTIVRGVVHGAGCF